MATHQTKQAQPGKTGVHATPEILFTDRLELVTATEELTRSELSGRRPLGRKLKAVVPSSWPPELYDHKATEFTIRKLSEGPEQAGWWSYYMISKPNSEVGRRTLVGVCGFKGPPDSEASVEIGYAVLPEFQRRGFATEAARRLVMRAFQIDTVERVVAHTLPHLAPSIGVLRKIGFRLVSSTLQNFGAVDRGSEEEVIRFELERRDFRPEP